MDGLQRNAWWGLFATAVLVVGFGVGDVISGVANDAAVPLGIVGRTPAQLEADGPLAYRMYDLTLRGGGLSLVMVGALMAAILLFAFRRWQRWAWWTMWLLPAWAFAVAAGISLIGIAPGQEAPPPLVSGVILGILSAAILLVSAPRFFGDRAN